MEHFKKRFLSVFQILVILLVLQCQSFAQEPETLRVVLIAGPNDHCDDNLPCHKYIQDMKIIRDCLLQQSGIKVTFLIGERPLIGSLDEVDVVVVHAASDDTESEWNALFPRLNQKKQYRNKEYLAFLNYLDKRMEEGMGLVALHYATSVNHKQSVKRYKKWIGGHFDDKTSQAIGDERNPDTFVALETVKLKTPNHPVLRGIKPWTTEAEYYYNLDIEDNAIPILTSALPINKPKDEVIAWAFERPAGGRGFGFTGCHNHNNMYLEDFRRFVLNIILWTGGLEVPKSGVQSKLTKRYF